MLGFLISFCSIDESCKGCRLYHQNQPTLELIDSRLSDWVKYNYLIHYLVNEVITKSIASYSCDEVFIKRKVTGLVGLVGFISPKLISIRDYSSF